MIKLILSIYSYFIAIFAVPFAWYAKLPIHPWHYYYCAIFASRIPFLFGDFFREWFYRFTIVHFGKGSRIMYGAILQTRDCSIGNNTLVGINTLVSHTMIGDDCMIGPHVHIISGSRSHGMSRVDIPMRLQEGMESHITIGSDVWIGSNVCIMKDILCGTVVGAGSVVTKEFSEYDIIVGNPARVLNNRKML